MPKFCIVAIGDFFTFVAEDVAYFCLLCGKKVFAMEYDIRQAEMNQYEDSLKNFRDMYSVITTAEKKGRAEGLAEGIAKGRTEGILEVAREMLAAGMPRDVVSQLTKFSREQLGNL